MRSLSLLFGLAASLVCLSTTSTLAQQPSSAVQPPQLPVVSNQSGCTRSIFDTTGGTIRQFEYDADKDFYMSHPLSADFQFNANRVGQNLAGRPRVTAIYPTSYSQKVSSLDLSELEIAFSEPVIPHPRAVPCSDDNATWKKFFEIKSGRAVSLSYERVVRWGLAEKRAYEPPSAQRTGDASGDGYYMYQWDNRYHRITIEPRWSSSGMTITLHEGLFYDLDGNPNEKSTHTVHFDEALTGSVFPGIKLHLAGSGPAVLVATADGAHRDRAQGRILFRQRPPDRQIGSDSLSWRVPSAEIIYEGVTCRLTGAGGVECFTRNGIADSNNQPYLGRGNVIGSANSVEGVGRAAPTGLGPKPLTANALNVRSIFRHDYQFCALTFEGKVLCWGRTAPRRGSSEVLVPTERTLFGSGVLDWHEDENNETQADFVCVTRVDGSVQCAEDESSSKLKTLSGVTFPVSVAINALARNVCAVTTSGALKCLSNPVDPFKDANDNDIRPLPTPPFHTATNVTKVAMGLSHTCVLLQGGAVDCFGSNHNGQMARDPRHSFYTGTIGTLNDNTWANVPVRITGLDAGVTDIAIQMDRSCALKGTDVICWGGGQAYQPTAVVTPAPAVALITGPFAEDGWWTILAVDSYGDTYDLFSGTPRHSVPVRTEARLPIATIAGGQYVANYSGNNQFSVGQGKWTAPDP